MGFLGSILGAAVKVALTPVGVVADVVGALDGKEPEVTKKLIKGAAKDIDDAIHSI